MRATVLIPTHDHGPTLRFAAGSALAQTVQDLEVLIVGDGATDDTREVAMQLEKDDERVRFFDNPKGPRHGEVHRHAAVQESRGRIVCYLSDDDLWLPEHVELLADALEHVDFAHTMTAWIQPDGGARSFYGNVADPRQRLRLLHQKWNFIPLSAAGHTMAAYQRLPEGWRTTPDNFWTDLYMWRQFLADAAVTAAAVQVPTVVHFASAERPGRTIHERVAEIAAYESRLRDPHGRTELLLRVQEDAIRVAYVELHSTGDRMDYFVASRDELQEQVRWLGEALAKAREQRDAVTERMKRMEESATWRLRNRLIRLPILGALHRRRAATARSRRAPR